MACIKCPHCQEAMRALVIRLSQMELEREGLT